MASKSAGGKLAAFVVGEKVVYTEDTDPLIIYEVEERRFNGKGWSYAISDDPTHTIWVDEVDIRHYGETRQSTSDDTALASSSRMSQHGHGVPTLSPPVANVQRTYNLLPFLVYWEMDAYLRSQNIDACDLDKAFTITSSGFGQVYANTAGNYVRWRWGGVGEWVFSQIVTLLNRYPVETGHGRVGGSARRGPIGMLVAFGLTERSLELEFLDIGDASLSTVGEVQKQLLWLAATFRTPPISTECLSTTTTTNSGAAWVLEPEMYSLPSRSTRSRCWASLIEGMPVAERFGVPPRVPGFSGLELPFDLLFRLCGVQYPLQYADGLVLKGFSTILIPIYVEENAIQWHLICSDRTECIGVEVLQDIDGAIPDPHFVLDEAYLGARRSFLGFYPSITNHLGTKYMPPTGLLSSDSPCEGPRLKFSSFVGQMGTSGLGFFGAAVGANIAWTSALAGLERINPISPLDRVHNAVHNPIILYNAVDRVAWLTSELCFMTQLLREFYYQADQVETLQQVPTMDSSDRGNVAAYNHIRIHWDDVLESGPNGRGITYGQRLEQFVSVLEQRKDSVKLRLIEGARPSLFSKMSFSNSLPAWDMLEMLHLSSIPRRRKITLKEQSWPSGFANNCNILCVCYQGLGDPFIPLPLSTQNLCNNCRQVPRGLDCLIAEAGLLPRGISEEWCWDANKTPPFKPCGRGCNGLRDRIQTIERAGKGKRTLPSELEGAVLFGNPKHFEKHQCDTAFLMNRLLLRLLA